MSTEGERTFGRARPQLTPQRSQLGEDILEASERVKQWLTVSFWSFDLARKLYRSCGLNHLDDLDRILRFQIYETD